MAKSTADLITIVRNVTGRVDNSDPLFTDDIILGYINDFYRLEMGQDLRIKENETWWEFTLLTTDPNPYPVVLQDINTQGVTTIGNLCYVDGFQIWWYQDPQTFFWKWPQTQDYEPSRPTDVLYYNNELLFRSPPDQSYPVKINAYRVEAEMVAGENISEDYLWRYVSYGAARDIFSDYGELDLWERYEPVFRKYRSLVYARTYQQQMSERSLPRF